MTTQNNNLNNEQIVREILEDEIKGDIMAALKKMHPEYSMTWVYKNRKGVLFPKVDSENIKQAMKEAYVIKGRRYDIKNLISQNDVVMIEMIESYPKPDEPEKVYRTPQVIVLELKDGKILRGRHYTDPQLSYEFLTEEQTDKIFE